MSQQAPPLRLFNQCEYQQNLSSSLINGLQSRPPVVTQGIGGQSTAAFYPIDRDDGGKYNLCLSPSGIYIMDEYGEWQTISHATGWQDYLSIPAGYDPYKAYKVLTLADQTFILNTTKVTSLAPSTYTAWRNQALVFVNAVNYTTTWTLRIGAISRSFGYGGQETDGTVKRYVDGALLAGDNALAINSTEVASHLAQIAVDGFTITQTNSTLWVRRNDGEAFTIGLADTRADTCSNLISSKVQQFGDLPTVAPNGYICRVVGAVSSTSDDYYVQFVTNAGTSFGKGTWEECAEPGSQYDLDAITMPWSLRHVTDTGWAFTQSEWDAKATGDLDSNPVPEFIGKRLRNIFLYRNRLCFIADDLLCMSRASDLTNWWNETAFALTDSDPIFLSASTSHLVDLYDFGILNDTLILFGDGDQYALSNSDILSPKTAALLPLSTNAYTNGTGIVTAGTRLYFGHKTGANYNCIEFGVSAVTGQKEATPITSHVPGLIPFGTRTRLSGSANIDALAVISNQTPDTIYVYQYYISGTNKLQSAWHKYVLAGCAIKGAFFRENILWLLMVKKGVTLIATLDMSERKLEDVVVCLDFGEVLTNATPTTTWTLPAHMDATNIGVIRYLPTGQATLAEVTSVDGQTITILTAETAIGVGQLYNWEYEFSTQYPPVTLNKTTSALTTGRWQLQQLTLNFQESGAFDVYVRPLYNTVDEGFLYKYEYRGVRVGSQSAIFGRLPMDAGSFMIPLRGRNTDLRVGLRGNSWLPVSFISTEWQGNYITKVKQV